MSSDICIPRANSWWISSTTILIIVSLSFLCTPIRSRLGRWRLKLKHKISLTITNTSLPLLRRASVTVIAKSYRGSTILLPAMWKKWRTTFENPDKSYHQYFLFTNHLSFHRSCVPHDSYPVIRLLKCSVYVTTHKHVSCCPKHTNPSRSRQSFDDLRFPVLNRKRREKNIYPPHHIKRRHTSLFPSVHVLLWTV